MTCSCQMLNLSCNIWHEQVMWRTCRCWVILMENKCHRSHFGSRYKLGCCGHASLFGRVRIPARALLCVPQGGSPEGFRAGFSRIPKLPTPWTQRPAPAPSSSRAQGSTLACRGWIVELSNPCMQGVDSWGILNHPAPVVRVHPSTHRILNCLAPGLLGALEAHRSITSS